MIYLHACHFDKCILILCILIAFLLNLFYTKRTRDKSPGNSTELSGVDAE